MSQDPSHTVAAGQIGEASISTSPTHTQNQNGNENQNQESIQKWSKSASKEAIKFLTTHLNESFTEEMATELFQFYTITDKQDKLEPADIRKLLLDVCEAAKWPLVVPNESLDSVLNELCLHNERGAVSWVEFKSFFVFLQDKPLTKLFQLTTQFFSLEQLNVARLVTLRPIQSLEHVSYDPNPFKHAIASSVFSEAGVMFIYFLEVGTVLALVLGDFGSPMEDKMEQLEISVGSIPYVAQIAPFLRETSVFPPIQRAGGMSTKVARKIADSYVATAVWDEQHFQIAKKTNKIGKQVGTALKDIDEKYKVSDNVNAAATAAGNAVKQFDEKHQVTRRLSDSAKSLDEQYQIRAKLSSTKTKIQSNPTYQSVSSTLGSAWKNFTTTVKDINKESKQLIHEKQSDPSHIQQTRHATGKVSQYREF